MDDLQLFFLEITNRIETGHRYYLNLPRKIGLNLTRTPRRWGAIVESEDKALGKNLGSQNVSIKDLQKDSEF